MLCQLLLSGVPTAARHKIAAALGREFPTLALGFVERPPTAVPCVDAAPQTWPEDRFLDAAVERCGRLALRINDAIGCVRAVTRYQRLIDRRNAASAGAAFDRALQRHKALHDLHQPLMRTALDHARDVWQWLLRLQPRAGQAVQLAALFRDVDRLQSRPDAGDSAAIVRRTLAGVIDDPTIDRVCLLVDPPLDDDSERRAIVDAEGLSFFSFASAGFLDTYGPAHTRRHIAGTLAQLSPRGRARLTSVGLRSDVQALLDSVG